MSWKNLAEEAIENKLEKSLCVLEDILYDLTRIDEAKEMTYTKTTGPNALPRSGAEQRHSPRMLYMPGKQSLSFPRNWVA